MYKTHNTNNFDFNQEEENKFMIDEFIIGLDITTDNNGNIV